MAIELGAAYISILPETSKIAPGVRQALGDTEKEAGRSGTRSGRSIAGGLLSGAKKAIGVGGIAATIVGGVAMKGGISRLLDIEDAQAKLRGLGHDAKSVEKIMSSATDAVTGTAFGMGEAASTAASAVAAGIKPGKELTDYLTLTADAATIAGVSMSEMGSIFGQVQTQQAAYTSELNRLNDRGIPIFEWLQEEYGVTAVELKKMVKAGEVDAETYRKVINDNIGGAALESGNTVRGAWKNLNASLGRMGANLLTGLGFENLAGLIQSATGYMKPLEDAAGRVGDALGGALGGMMESLRGAAGGGIDLSGWGDSLSGAFSAVSDFAADLLPSIQKIAGGIIGALGPGLAAIGGVIRDDFLPAFSRLLPILTPVVKFLVEAFGSAIIGAIEGAGRAIKGIVKVISGVFNLVSSLITGDWGGAWDALKQIFQGAIDFVVGAIKTWWNIGILAVFRKGFLSLTKGWKGLWEGLKALPARFFNMMQRLFQSGLKAIWNIFKGGIKLYVNIWRGLFNGLRNLATKGMKTVRGAFSGPLNAIRGVFSKAIGGIRNVWSRGVQAVRDVASKVWGGITGVVRRVMDATRKAFDKGVSGIKKVWNGIKSAASAPVRFVVDTVYNNGLRKMIGAIPGVGAPPYVSFGGFARGGYTGPGAMWEPAGIVHRDEFVIRKSARRRFEKTHPGMLDYLNTHGELPGYGLGGLVGDALGGVTNAVKGGAKKAKKWLKAIGRMKDTLFGLSLGSLTGEWGGYAKSAARNTGRGAIDWMNNKIPNWGPIPDNPIPYGIFDNGGILEPGAIAVNASRKPEAVFNHRQFREFAEAIANREQRASRTEFVITNWKTGEGFFREIAEDTYNGEEAYAGTIRRMHG